MASTGSVWQIEPAKINDKEKMSHGKFPLMFKAGDTFKSGRFSLASGEDFPWTIRMAGFAKRAAPPSAAAPSRERLQL